MAFEHFGETGAPQIFHILLPDPCAMVLRFSLPVKIGAPQVAAAGVAFEDNGAARQRAQ